MIIMVVDYLCKIKPILKFQIFREQDTCIQESYVKWWDQYFKFHRVSLHTQNEFSSPTYQFKFLVEKWTPNSHNFSHGSSQEKGRPYRSFERSHATN